jgi:hypothetical protein
MVPEEVLTVNDGAVHLKMVSRRRTHRRALMHMVKELDAGTRLIIVGDQARLPAEALKVEDDDYLTLPGRAVEVWA